MKYKLSCNALGLCVRFNEKNGKTGNGNQVQVLVVLVTDLISNFLFLNYCDS